MTTLLTVVHVLACLGLIGLVLIQPGREEGMAGAFGGMGGSVAFGVKTLDVLWKITVGFAAVFMLTALALTVMDKDQFQPAPATPPAPAAPAAPHP